MRVWPAPAKLNLFLHVTGRRADGYHELQTVFQFLDFCDELQFEPAQDGDVRHLEPIPGVDTDRELCVRAARLLQSMARPGSGVRIRLRKRVPLGGGLGGGSSDAATTLVALNRIWGLGLPVEHLAELGLQLGADVPVFVHGQAAWAEGVGERLVPVDLPEPWYLVLVPPVQVSTAAIFADPELTRDSPPITIRAFREGAGRNDLEPVVRRHHPEVGKVLDWLTQFGPARMTGSGACVFLQCDDRAEAERILAQRPRDVDGFVARGLNRSPLLARCAESD